MKGYLKDEAATEKAFEGGWFHSGDLAVVHDNGYVEIRDRCAASRSPSRPGPVLPPFRSSVLLSTRSAKAIIISGWTNPH